MVTAVSLPDMSTPPSPHTSPKKGKYMIVKVILLDDSIQSFQIPHKALGWTLFDGVLQKLQVLEADYFDLEFSDHHGNPCWLDHEKPIIKQITSPHDLTFRFLVKFYTPDPGLLEEEYTRYLFALQIRRDIMTGCMLCLDHTAVLIAAYVVQAELGDFLEDEYRDPSYLSGQRILPNQDDRLEHKIMEQHKKLIGQSPAEADFNLLDTARKVEQYGIRMHAAKDHEGVYLHLAVAHMGVLVFQNTTKINTFSWAKIRKLSFKRKKFLIKLHPEGYGYYKDTVEFYFESRNECKNFWKKCLEHHAFFRCHSVKRLPRNKTRVVSRGSSFRYSGRTQKQLVEYVRDNYFKRPPFERSTSLRTVSSATRSVGATPNTGTLNSRDINFGHNTSTSSGSHTLDMPGGGSPKDERRVETAEVHDDSSQSGSRSLNSPKKDRYARSGSEDLNNDYEEEDRERHDHVGVETKDLADGQSPRAHRIDPSQFMLSKADRKFSEPAFNLKAQQGQDDQYLSRCPEVENIPERVQENREDKQFQNHSASETGEPPANLRRSQSETTPETSHLYQDGVMSQMAATAIAEESPPPPPPIYQEEWAPRGRRGPPLREVKEREMREDITVTTSTRSTTSAASATLTSSCSVTSSRGGTDDSEEDVRKKKKVPTATLR